MRGQRTTASGTLIIHIQNPHPNTRKRVYGKYYKFKNINPNSSVTMMKCYFIKPSRSEFYLKNFSVLTIYLINKILIYLFLIYMCLHACNIDIIYYINSL